MREVTITDRIIQEAIKYWQSIKMRLLTLNILFILIAVIGYSQNNLIAEAVDSRIKIYLDCDDCNFSFFRRSITYVDFVRDAKLAEVHIFVTEQKTASNSVEYALNFIGFNQFSDLQYKLKAISPQEESDILKWERLLKIIDIGLLPYLSRTPEIAGIKIVHESIPAPQIQENVDPWNYWVFRIKLGSDFESEKSKKEYSLSNSFEADRITELIKFRSEVSYDFDKKIYKDDDEKIESKKKKAELDASIVYSLNPRWSSGIFGNVSTSSYLNLNTASEIGPAIEYNIFPWDKSDRKVFTIGYHIKAHYFKYNESTIFDKLEESRASESLKLSLLLRQPWGEIESTLEGSHYFHDFSKNRVSLETDISINIIKGLSLFMELESDLIHDQLYLPGGEISRDDLLLQQKKLATNFEFSAELGIRFTFGSVYNNIINQRL